MNLNKLVKRFFEESEYQKIAEKIVVIRRDGINIYSNINNNFEASSMGALIGGVWQAAQALSELTDKNQKVLEYRLSFDTSSNGLYILPLVVANESYFLGAVYQDKNNPAKLKQHLRMLKDNLELYLSDFCNETEVNNEKRDGYLFNSITDDEMDNLFSFDGV